MQFVELANRYNSKIEVSNGVLAVDAKSIMSVMRLAATQGTTLRIVADGADAAEAADSLAGLVSDGFGPAEHSVEVELETEPTSIEELDEDQKEQDEDRGDATGGALGDGI